MFEPGASQAAGLRAALPAGGASLVPLASPAQPVQAFDWLCTLAAELQAAGQPVAVIDGTAAETGAPLGLLHALNDPSVAHLGHPADHPEWLVMPGAQGLGSLVSTAAVAGAGAALSRLLAPFAAGVLVLLFAAPVTLVSLLGGLPAHALVPVIAQPQAAIDTYATAKLLHLHGLRPVLAPATLQGPLAQTTASVVDCAHRHLGAELAVWPAATWASRLPDAALTRPDIQAWGSAAASAAPAAPALWS